MPIKEELRAEVSISDIKKALDSIYKMTGRHNGVQTRLAEYLTENNSSGVVISKQMVGNYLHGKFKNMRKEVKEAIDKLISK